MVAAWSQIPALHNATDIASVTASSTGTTLSSSNTANAKGSYTQLIASTGHDAIGILLAFDSSMSAGGELSVDVAIGGAGSEQVIVPDLLAFGNVKQESVTVFLPLAIPSGTRVAARCQSTLGGSVGQIVQAHIVDGDWTNTDGRCAVDTYGFVSAGTHGTSVDPGGTINTKGAWSQLTASTTNDICGLMVGFDCAGNQGSSGIFASILVDIGIGAGGSEVVLVPNIPNILLVNNGILNYTYTRFSPVYQVQIPSGTRIAARCQSQTNAATQRNLGVVVYGLRC